MFRLPFFTELEGARRVLLAGAGHGFGAALPPSGPRSFSK
jgi:hypothetical protein